MASVMCPYRLFSFNFTVFDVLFESLDGFVNLFFGGYPRDGPSSLVLNRLEFLPVENIS